MAINLNTIDRNSITRTLSATTAKGALVTTSNLNAFTLSSTEATQNNEVAMCHWAPQVVVDKQTATTVFAVGALVYINSTSNAVTTASGNQLVGVCLEASASGTDSVKCTFDGVLAYAKA